MNDNDRATESTFDEAALLAAYVGRVQDSLVIRTRTAKEQAEWLGELRNALSKIRLVHHDPSNSSPRDTYHSLGASLYLLEEHQMWGFLPGLQLYEYSIPVSQHPLLAPLFIISVTPHGTFRIESRLKGKPVELKQRNEVQDWIFDFYAELGYGPKIEGINES